VLSVCFSPRSPAAYCAIGRASSLPYGLAFLAGNIEGEQFLVFADRSISVCCGQFSSSTPGFRTFLLVGYCFFLRADFERSVAQVGDA
jgi:hypothetical protein